MENKKLIKSVVAMVLLIVCGQAIAAQKPRVFILNPQILEERKTKISDAKSSDSSFKTAIAKLESEAKQALKTEVLSIITKQADPPSGDRHDYMSQAPYFWRNPATPTGLPYIRKDGERNPEIKRFPDHELLDKMEDAVEHLALAYYFTNKPEYAAKAAEILRMWFLDAKTKMNPNLEFAQAIPGQNTGRGIGIIETRGLTRVVDAVGLLDGAKAWTKADQKGVEAWFGDYLKWLTTSKNGLDEAAAKNNHGTFYDVQVADFALFAGNPDFAKNVLETAKQKRLAKQIEPDGRQPLELVRTKSWSYSAMNLDGFVALADLGDSAGVDLWNFQTADGRSIRRAIEFLAPFLDAKKKWTFEQIEPLEPEKLFPLIRRASRKFADEKFSALASAIPKLRVDDEDSLLY